MCNKGNPSTVSNQNATTTSAGSTSGSSATASSGVITPLPETLALYQDLLNRALATGNQPFDTRTMPDVYPWVVGGPQDVAANYQYDLGRQGMGFVPEAAAALGQGAQSTIGEIPGVAASLLSPWAGQAVDFGMSQGQAIGDFGQSQGQAIGDWATGRAEDIMSAGPQLQPFSEEAVMQYYSPYQQNVIDATQNWFNNQNAIQGNQLIGQGIRQGNMFGGDRAGVAQGVLAGQQQLAQAPVIAGLYNQGYAQALQEFNVENALAAQLQQFGASLGLQGLQAQGQLGLQGLTAQGALGMQGLGMGLNAATAANQQAIGALGQNQQAALQAGSLFGNLGATQFGSNLAGGQQAIGAASIYPQYIQNLMNQAALNEMTMQAYPFQTTSWYGSLLGGLGPLTGAQQANASSSVSQQIANQIANQMGQTTTTPPQPNQWTQLAGLGLAGLGLFLKDGGEVPRRAQGGGQIGTVPYQGGRGYVPATNIPLGRLQQPSMPNETAARLANILNAPSFSIPKSGGSGSSGSSNTISDLTSLLSSSSAKKIAGSLSSDSGSGSGTGSEDAEVLARGGLVNRYQWGGGLANDEDPMPFGEHESAGLPDMEMATPEWAQGIEPTEGAAAAPLGIDYGPGGPDEEDEVPLPQPRPAEAPRGLVPTPQGGGGGYWERGAAPRSQPGFMQRWAANPLTQMGLALASAQSPYALTNIGRGLAAGTGAIQAERHRQEQQERLDQKYSVDNSGETQKVRFADGRIWNTGLPTRGERQLQQNEQRLQQNEQYRQDQLEVQRERNKMFATGETRRQQQADTGVKREKRQQEELETVKQPREKRQQDRSPKEEPAPVPPKAPEVKAVPPIGDVTRDALQALKDRRPRAEIEARIRSWGYDPSKILPPVAPAPTPVPMSQ